MRGDNSASRIVTSAPMRSPTPGSWRMFRSSDNRPRLKRAAGAISRFFSMMTSAVPPEMIFVSSPCTPRSESASSSEFGCNSLMFAICVGGPSPDFARAQHAVPLQVVFVAVDFMSLFAPLFFQRAQDFFRGNRQIEKVMTDGAADRIPDRRAHGRDGGLADAVHFRDAMGFEQMNRHRGWNILERRDHVIGEIGIGN